jgi:hypothetical protein
LASGWLYFHVFLSTIGSQPSTSAGLRAGFLYFHVVAVNSQSANVQLRNGENAADEMAMVLTAE